SHPTGSSVVPTLLYPCAAPACCFFDRRTRLTSRAFGSPKTPRTVGCTRNPPNAYVSHNRRSRLFDAAIATPCQNSPYRKMLQARCPRGFQTDSTPNFTHSITRRPRFLNHLFSERRNIASAPSLSSVVELSKSCGLGWQGRERRGDRRGARGDAPLGRTQSERRRRLALAGGFFKAPQFGQCSMSMSKTRLSSLANSCAPARPARECLHLRSRGRALPEREPILLRNFASGAKTPWRIRRP